MNSAVKKSRVIGNKVSAVSPVIGNATSNARAEFDRYASELRLLISVKASESGRAGGAWWVRLPESLRCYLLFTVAPDDFQRYASTVWAGLPSGLRSALWLECHRTLRALQGCPWR